MEFIDFSSVQGAQVFERKRLVVRNRNSDKKKRKRAVKLSS